MEGKAFAKLCKDNKLLCKAVTPTDVDLIFAKVKAKGQRKINFEEFIKGLDLIAAKKVRRSGGGVGWGAGTPPVHAGRVAAVTLV
jgi:hypothetical protein